MTRLPLLLVLPAVAFVFCRFRVTPFLRWYDLWVGVFIDTNKRAVYICPLPMIGVKIELRG